MNNLIESLKKISNQPIVKSDIVYVSELKPGLQTLKSDIPIDLASFYNEANGGTLFKDQEYEQWGMTIYSYDELRERNKYVRTWKENLLASDLVIAEFLGDLDLLILSENNGEVIIAAPLYERKNWFFLKCGFLNFLEKYIQSKGEKFWE